MTVHIHKLKGCSPTPLALYLKGLGILRIIAEQADSGARGWWQDEQFCLMTNLTRDELESFFVDSYVPTPLLAPWNGGSGFYRTWDEKNERLRNSKNADALNKLADSTNPRMKFLAAAVDEVRSILPRFCKSVDVSTLSAKERNKLLILPIGEGPSFPVIEKNDAGKLQVQRCLLRYSRASEFYRSVLVEVEENVKCPWLWGSGGNDGAIDYTGRFFENLSLVLSGSDQSIKLHRESFYSEICLGMLSQAKGKVGQFAPLSAGGANVSNGFGSQQETHLNPWDYVLAMEGAVAFRSSASRLLQANAARTFSVPFAIKSHPAGHATPGNEANDRDEQWMPIWDRPSCFADVSNLVQEGRIAIGRRTAIQPIDAARAISRLAAARGISEFVRYGYLQRNGKSIFCVPLQRIHVRENRNSHLINDSFANWMTSLQRLARDSHAPARLVQAERRLADAVFAALTHDYTSERWRLILEAAADIEAIQAAGTAFKAGPIPKLKCAWVEAIYPDDPGKQSDDAREVRLALSLAGAASFRPVYQSVRHHFLPLKYYGREFQSKEKRLVADPRVVATGRDPVADLVAIVFRRFIDAENEDANRLPLHSAMRCGARLPDLAALIDGNVDLHRVLKLARALMALDWRQWNQSAYKKFAPRTRISKYDEHPEEAWLAIRLASLPWSFKRNETEIDISAEHSIVRRLAAGDGGAAVQIASRRLTASGLRPPFTSAFTDDHTARLWAAALAFPISEQTAALAVNILNPDLSGATNA